MVRSLTKRNKKGVLYTRPQAIEAHIEGALQDDMPTLRRRLSVTDKASPEYLLSECLIHIFRDAFRAGDDQRRDAVLVVLLGRCEAILKAKISDRVPNADVLRDYVLSEFSDLLASDGTGEMPDELDFYECKFNLAFRALYVDVLRQELPKVNLNEELPDDRDKGDPDAYEDPYVDVPEELRTRATQLDLLSMKDLRRAIDALPPDECKAVILCHVMGYKEESEDPDQITAATLCDCTGRTIRNRLSRAAAKLLKFKEDV